MLEAYPVDLSQGAPFDGRNTTYGEPSQYKRTSAIASDTMYTAPWRWYLQRFSQNTKIWGIHFEEPITGERPVLGMQHGSDFAFYFPEMFGEGNDPRKNGDSEFVDTVHDAFVHFVNSGSPNDGHQADCATEGAYHWPEYGASGMVTVLNASLPAATIEPPYRPGFDLIQRYLIRGPDES